MLKSVKRKQKKAESRGWESAANRFMKFSHPPKSSCCVCHISKALDDIFGSPFHAFEEQTLPAPPPIRRILAGICVYIDMAHKTCENGEKTLF